MTPPSWFVTRRNRGKAPTGSASPVGLTAARRVWVRRMPLLAAGLFAAVAAGFLGWAVWPVAALPVAAATPWLLVTQLAVMLVFAGLLGAALFALIVLTRRLYRQRRALREARRELLQSRQQLGALLEATTEGVILTAADGTIESFNPAAELMFGQISEDVLGRRVCELLPDLLLSETRALLDGPVLATSGEPPVHPFAEPPPDPEASFPMRELRACRGGHEHFPVRVCLRVLTLAGESRLLLVVHDLTEITRNAQQLTFLAQHDVITGLLNRKEFERRLQRLLIEAAGSETPYVLCYIDIDQFKVVNDTMGFAAGDALVEQLATLIQARLDRAALIGRMGGDEFAALLVDYSERRALDLCEGLMQTVRHFLFVWRDRSFDVAVSIGLTAFLPEHESAAAELAKADVACHMAKHLGRDRIHVYRDGDTSVIRHHGDMHLVSTISEALNSGRFRLFVQPIMPLAAGSTEHLHYEVLVRMLDDQGDLIAPSGFIPAAEQYILMPAVDRWIIHQLFSTQAEVLRAWHAANAGATGGFLFAVNLSGTSVADDSFLPYLRRQFEVHRIPPPAICFEVTETAAIRDMDAARIFMQEIVNMGCSLALDDFGSGLASYGYLRDLPVRYLKIDGSFVRDMHTNAVNHALVASINQVGHVLGLRTIAEWAEEAVVVEQLRVLGVDYAQGFAIGRPVPVSEFRPDAASAAGAEDLSHG